MADISFSNPHLLWALPLAAAPVIIYFLMRFRAVTVPWGADYVLERALERLRKKLFVDQLLLMVLRTLAAAGIVVAIARPLTSRQSGSAGAVQGSGVHHIVVLDDSASTLARVAGGGATTIWEREKEILHRLVTSWGRGERWSLLLAADEPRWVREYAEITDLDEAARVVESLEQPGEESAALGRALALALAAAGDRPAEIVLIADDQASSWAGAEDALPVAAGGPRREVTWVRLSPRDRDNLAITGVAVSPEVCLAGHPCTVEVKVRSFASAPVDDVSVELLLDGSFAARSSTPIQPGQEATLTFTISPPEAGSHRLAARLPDDVLPADDEAFAGIDVRGRASLMVCRDPAKEGTFASAGGFLTLVAEVASRTAKEGGPLVPAAPLVVETCAEDCSAAALQKADVVVVDGGSRLDPDLVAALALRVDAGGAVLLAPDPGIDVDAWNEAFAAVGLLPAKVTAAVEGSPGMEPVRRLPGSAAAFHSWLDLEPVPGQSVVLRSFADGGPFAVGLSRRGGTVVELAAGLNARINNLVVFVDVLPTVVDLVTLVMSRASHPRTVQVGEAIALALPAAGDVAGVTFGIGDAEPVPVEPAPVVRLAGGARRSGLGSFLLLPRDSAGGAAERVWIGVQGPRKDADLAALAKDRETQAAAAIDLTTVGSWEELDRLLERRRTGRDWQPWLLAALAAVLVGETALCRRFV
jgi:hypothetical protein